MAKELVYVCSEGRPWKEVAPGRFGRVSVESLNTVKVVTPTGEFLRVTDRPTKRKPYELERGF